MLKISLLVVVLICGYANFCVGLTVTTTTTTIITDVSNRESDALPNFVNNTQYVDEIFAQIQVPMDISLVANPEYDIQYEWYVECMLKNYTRKELYIFHNRWFEQNIQNWTDILINGNNRVGDAVRNAMPIKALEIGSFEGASSVFTLENLVGKNAHSELFVIDTFQGSGAEHYHYEKVLPLLLPLYSHNIYVSGFSSQVRIIQGSSLVELPKLITFARMITSDNKSNGNIATTEDSENCEYFDFIYVDGSHKASDVLVDAIHAFQLLKIGGIMIFDDYLRVGTSTDEFDQAKRGVDAFLSYFQPKLDIVRIGYQLYITKTQTTDIL